MFGRGRRGRRGIGTWRLFAAVVFLTWLGPRAARAEPPTSSAAAAAEPPCPADAAERRTHCVRPRATGRLAWRPEWGRFRPAEYVASGLFLGGALASLAIPPDEERWTDAGGFDGWMRRRLRVGTAVGRDRARDASDVLLAFGVNHLVVDAAVVAWWAHGSEEVAWQLAMIDVEAMTLNALLNGVVAGLTSRERPYADRCADPTVAHTDDCSGNKRYRSFYSGHTSTAFTVAGLTCMHHAHLPLYGSRAADTLACSTSFLHAAAVGMLRVVSDQHYTTDVLAGAAIGTLTGLGVPWLLHYRSGGAPSDAGTVGTRTATARRWALGVVPGPTGGALWGVF